MDYVLGNVLVIPLMPLTVLFRKKLEVFAVAESEV